MRFIRDILTIVARPEKVQLAPMSFETSRFAISGSDLDFKGIRIFAVKMADSENYDF